ncbi:CHAT domain-containing protein [Vararia minispora EC-137]|uniref:CHAT domain-containing protein n=1 Tax=Vararia minispora EC-137 TaxID=1314806 RepID=A0ACB8Q783_9AGAM|nr:CHAT domain-containing protein [Vararia minispora EC-137]
MTRFRLSGDPDDLTPAVVALRDANSAPEEHGLKQGILDELSSALELRFERRRDPADLEEAIVYRRHRDRLPRDGDPHHSRFLSNFSLALRNRFECYGRAEDIAEAVVLSRRAVSVHPSHRIINNLGSVLIERFRSSGGVEDLEEAIECYRRAFNLSSDPFSLKCLCDALGDRFLLTGKLKDIDEAIEVGRRAVQFTADDDPEMPVILTSLCTALEERFKRLEDVLDINDAISVGLHAIKLTPEGYPYEAERLAQLGAAFYGRFSRLRDIGDLDNAILFMRRAITSEAPAKHTFVPVHLNNLGMALCSRFNHVGAVEDLDEAIPFIRRAVTLSPSGHQLTPICIANLSTAYSLRFTVRKDISDIDEAISLLESLIEHPAPNGDRDKVYLNLCSAFAIRLTFSPSPSRSDFQSTIQSFMHAISPGVPCVPSAKVASAELCASLCRSYPNFSSPSLLIQIYAAVFDIISEVVWLGHSISRRFDEVMHVAGIVHAAAVAAIEAGEAEKALEWLEEGRAIVWGQVLRLRTPIDELRQHDEQLAVELQQVAATLADGGHPVRPEDALRSPDLSLQRSRAIPEEAAQKQRRLSERYEQLLAQVRGIEEFKNFLRPKKLRDLAPAAAGGPVVFINVHESRCDALVLVRDGRVVHVPLPMLTHKLAETMRMQLASDLRRAGLRTRGAIFTGESGKESQDVVQILGALWSYVVQPVASAIEDIVPHITWCPTGPLAFLPLHAAGDYRPGPKRLALFDFVVSSYTPTLDALLKSRSTDGPHIPTDEDVLVVSQPNTPGCTSLPGAAAEAKTILENHFPSSVLLSGEDATVGAVLERISRFRTVHLACHGTQDLEDPLKSAFLLHDGRLELSQLMSTSTRSAELAVLSACQTAAGAAALPDEAVHLAASMLAVGYRGVVGTMWSIWDEDGPVIADAFYAALKLLRKRDEVEERSDVAYALHEAVERLREKVGERNVLRWVPFVHFGL